MRVILMTMLGLAAFSLAAGCDRSADNQDATESETGAATRRADAPDADHAHGEDGHTHGDEPHDDGHDGGHDEAHDEVPLGTVTIGRMEIELAQGHGKVAAGEESHLVVKLPYNDQGATTVRAWLGTEDRTQSYVGKGEYAPSHNDYDIHAVAPDPLPEDVMWWIEIEKPDGTAVVGSAAPRR